MTNDLTVQHLKLSPNARKHLSINEKLNLILARLDNVDLEIFKLRNDLAVTFGDEFNPKRTEMSQELASRMEKKLKAEERARLMYGPGEMEYKKDDE